MLATRAAAWGALVLCLFSSACAKKQAIYAPEPKPIQALPPRYSVCAFDPKGCGGSIEKLSASSSRGGGGEILLTGALAGAPTVGERSGMKRLVHGARNLLKNQRPPRAPTAVETGQPQRGRELIDLEAHLTIETKDLFNAAEKARRLTQSAGGQIVNETYEDNESQAGHTQSIRVPSDRAAWLIEALCRLGEVRSRRTEATDLGRKMADAGAVLENLEVALLRYQELAKKAASVAELTALEQELERVRTSLDRVKADLAWMSDRVARSTVYLQLARPVEERVSNEAKLYPGLRAPFVVTLDPDGRSTRYLGGGLSVLLHRTFNFDLDLLTNLDGTRRKGIDLLVATLGVELYSNLLGAGRRRFLNPYFGFRGGYASFFGDDAVALGGSLGVELFRTEAAFVALEGRAYAVVATDQGSVALFQPAATLHVAY
jgi:hypothetical protein